MTTTESESTHVSHGSIGVGASSSVGLPVEMSHTIGEAYTGIEEDNHGYLSDAGSATTGTQVENILAFFWVIEVIEVLKRQSSLGWPTKLGVLFRVR